MYRYDTTESGRCQGFLERFNICYVDPTWAFATKNPGLLRGLVGLCYSKGQGPSPKFTHSGPLGPSIQCLHNAQGPASLAVSR